MSVDYQSQLSAGGKFTITEDTQVVMCAEGDSGWHAYVHYMTLFDINARGFVRPFCLCFVTTNKVSWRWETWSKPLCTCRLWY